MPLSSEGPPPDEVPESPTAPDALDATHSDTSSADLQPALDALRKEVERAAQTIDDLQRETRHLREENDQLRRRIESLEEDPGANRDDTVLLLDEDPDALRRRIEDFIEALDAQLAGGS